MTAIAPARTFTTRRRWPRRARCSTRAADPAAMQREVLAAVERNARWRGRECINLLAPEAPISPTVRALLSAEVGQRAAEGHIGPANRWFAGTRHIDEIEALCVELLKRLFGARYAEHRLVASMIGNMAVYAALTEPGDTMMSDHAALRRPLHNRHDGPAGVRGLHILDVPFDPRELEVDLDAFARSGARGAAASWSRSAPVDDPLPASRCARSRRSSREWGGRVFFDGAHQLGLIAGGQFQDPLREGADVLTGSAGKTFSGPQIGRHRLGRPGADEAVARRHLPHAGRHPSGQPRRRARRGRGRVARVRPRVHGRDRRQRAGARRARWTRAACRARRPQGLHAHAPGDRRRARASAAGSTVAHRLAEANIITNKNLIPTTSRPTGTARAVCASAPPKSPGWAWARTRWSAIADLIAGVLVEGRDTSRPRRSSCAPATSASTIASRSNLPTRVIVVTSAELLFALRAPRDRRLVRLSVQRSTRSG